MQLQSMGKYDLHGDRLARIRSATNKDISSIVRLVNNENKRSNAVLRISAGDVQRWIENGLSLVAVQEGRIVAHEALDIWPLSGWAELRSAVVLERFRGKGLGYAITVRLIEVYLKRKPDALFIALKNRNERGIGILKSLGFADIDIRSVPGELFTIRSPDVRKAFIMRKDFGT